MTIGDLDQRAKRVIDDFHSATDALIELVQYLRYRHPLTDLPNLAAFERDLGAVDANAAMAVLVMDVDALKALNQQYGHAGADALLKSIGAVLKRCAEQQSSLRAYHWSGDEFAGLVTGCDRDEVKRVADHVFRQLFEARHDVPGSKDRGVEVRLTVAAAVRDEAGDWDQKQQLVAEAERLVEYWKAFGAGTGAPALVTVDLAGDAFAAWSETSWGRSRVRCNNCGSYGYLMHRTPLHDCHVCNQFTAD